MRILPQTAPRSPLRFHIMNRHENLEVWKADLSLSQEKMYFCSLPITSFPFDGGEEQGLDSPPQNPQRFASRWSFIQIGAIYSHTKHRIKTNKLHADTLLQCVVGIFDMHK